MAGQGTAANAMGLVKSILDFPGSSTEGTIGELAKSTYDWLVRERIDSDVFEMCKQRARGLTYPNTNGFSLKKAIEASDNKILRSGVKAPLKLVVSGSLGRLLSREPDLCYLVTTCAALARCHDHDYAADLVCAMIFDRGGHQDALQAQYSWQRAPVGSVLRKIMKSVYVNIINPGLSLADLPPALDALHHHCLNPATLAAIIMGIQSTKGDVFARSQYFLVDLVSWLMYHFSGRLEVSVDSQVIFSQPADTSQSRTFHFNCQSCPGDHEQCDAEDGTLQVGTMHNGTFTPFLSHRSDYTYRLDNTVRAALYEVSYILGGPHSALSGLLEAAEIKEIIHATQKIMNWLLGLGISPKEGDEIAFQVDLNGEWTGSTNRLHDILRNHPGLGNIKTGIRKSSILTFTPPEIPLDGSLSDLDSFYDNCRTPETVISAFPHAIALIQEDLMPRCSCNSCTEQLRLDTCKRGCIRHAAIILIFTLLGQGLAEGLGASDVSSRIDSYAIALLTAELFSDVIFNRVIKWESWFHLFACVVLGIKPFRNLISRSGACVEGPATLVAAQLGSLVVMADWLDIDRHHSLNGCFSVAVFHGAVEGIHDDRGIIHLERPGQVVKEVRPRPGPQHSIGFENEDSSGARFMDLSPVFTRDTVPAEKTSVMFTFDPGMYSLLTVIRTGNQIRMIDPSLGLRNIIAAKTIECDRSRFSLNPSDLISKVQLGTDVNVCITDFSEVMSSWTPEFQPAYICMTKILKQFGSALKFNMAMSLAHRQNLFVFDVKRCCGRCALNKCTNEATIIVQDNEDGYYMRCS